MRTITYYSRLTLVLTLMALLSSCADKNKVGCGCLSSVFQGFRLVQRYSAQEGKSARFSEPQPVPQSFEFGKVYVFESSVPVMTENISITMFPDRLRQCGAKKIKAPQSPNDLAPVNLGGPAWEIRFDLGRCSGRISNRRNPDLLDSRRGWPSGSLDDYLLEITERR